VEAGISGKDKIMEEKLLTVKEAAKLFNVSESHIHNLISMGRLPCKAISQNFKGRGYRRIPYEALVDYFSSIHRGVGKVDKFHFCDPPLSLLSWLVLSDAQVEVLFCASLPDYRFFYLKVRDSHNLRMVLVVRFVLDIFWQVVPKSKYPDFVRESFIPFAKACKKKEEEERGRNEL
jgi:excisionase family DNA binding protein